MSRPPIDTRNIQESSVNVPVNPPVKKPCRREYNVSNRSCEIVVNGLKEITKKFEKSCKVAINVVKANPRTKFKTHFCVTAVPELMDRVHSLDFSNRIIFLDGTGNPNRFNCSVFILMVDSHVGALPFGFFITSHKSASLLEPTFNALVDIMPSNAFNTPPFPKVMIVGIDPAEYTAVTRCFPSVKAYIGTFHLLRDVWRFLWDSQNGIAPNDRAILYKLFKDIILSQNDEQLNCSIWICSDSVTSRKYPEFLKYFQNLLKRKDLWGLDFRVRNNIFYNKNILTSEMHVLKENILHKSRIYSVKELFEFLCTEYCNYYIRKIIEAINGSLLSLRDSRYMLPCSEEMDDFKIGNLNSEEVSVISMKRNFEFYVNTELGTCTCVLGKHGTPCIHQSVVAQKFNSELLTVAPMNDEEKLKYCYLATGAACDMDESIFTHVRKENEVSENKVDETNCITEYVVVSHVNDCDLPIDSEGNYTIEDCVRAIETFWSKLSPYTEKHPNTIYQWISNINHKLDDANSIDDVVEILYPGKNS